jgi:hypothetical protein
LSSIFPSVFYAHTGHIIGESWKEAKGLALHRTKWKSFMNILCSGRKGKKKKRVHIILLPLGFVPFIE